MKNYHIAALLGYIAAGFGTTFQGHHRPKLMPSFYNRNKSREAQDDAIIKAQAKRERKNRKRLLDMASQKETS